MGFTAGSTGRGAADKGLFIQREDGDKVIALAGNPNVGKSTVFNELTGLNQHTGNWPGKTVTNAQGQYTHKGMHTILVDIPGTYSWRIPRRKRWRGTLSASAGRTASWWSATPPAWSVT